MFDELLNFSKTKLQDVDTYRPLPENQLARAAVTRLNPSRQTGFSGSITVIYGPSGIGKTHLARSTLKELVQRNPKWKFAFASTKRLCELMQQAEESQSLAEFLDQCRSLDLVICEDLQWLEEFPTLQPLFLMLIEVLEEGFTRILITSQKPVGEIRGLDQRLVSRCHGGLCVSMPMLSLDSRVQLVQTWFREMKLPILKPFAAAVQCFAGRLPVTPRELKQAVQDLAAKQTRKPTAIDVAYLERWLGKNHRTPRLSFEMIVRQVALEFGVNPSEIRSRSRQQGLAVPRQCAMWLARELTGQPLDKIGSYFDRSHTTVSHSLSRLNELLPTIPSVHQQIQNLRKRLNELPREECG